MTTPSGKHPRTESDGNEELTEKKLKSSEKQEKPLTILMRACIDDNDGKVRSLITETTVDLDDGTTTHKLELNKTELGCALMYAILCGNLKLVKALVHSGANFHALGGIGGNTVDLANPEIMKYLLQPRDMFSE